MDDENPSLSENAVPNEIAGNEIQHQLESNIPTGNEPSNSAVDDTEDEASPLHQNEIEQNADMPVDALDVIEVQQQAEDADMLDGIRIADRLMDNMDTSSQSSSGSSIGDTPPLVHNVPIRSFVEHLVRRVNAGEIGITDGVIARLRRMVYRLDSRLQRGRGRLSEDNIVDTLRADNPDSGISGTNRDSHENSDEDEITSPNAIQFDTNIPAEHLYLGSNMSRVSGVNYLETGQQYTIMMFMHQHLLFPGEILPFMISENVFENEDIDPATGMLFGVCFPFMTVEENIKGGDVYGVTCHIYEKGTDEIGNMLIKSRALQRFVMNRNAYSGPLQYIASHPRFKCRGVVRILPETFLPEPLDCIRMGSLERFRNIGSMRPIFKRYQAATTPFPLHVYEHYSISPIIEKARTKLAQHKIDTMPTDPVQLSFWLVRNLHLSEELAKAIFATDSVNIRMKLIESSFKEDAVFVCRYCGNCIAECRELFAMSKYGVQTQYCNSAGYIHETNTVYHVTPEAISFSGEPSTEFSWFPGYQWHIINCQVCTRHIGWQFKAVESNLIPKSFYGISSSSVRISNQPELDSRANVYRGLVRQARRRID